MVKLQSPVLSLIASGSIGGLTYARGRHGAYARIRSTPVNPRSETGSFYRYSVFQQILNQWISLSISLRNGWEDFAKIYKRKNCWGQRRQATGWEWFMSLNLRALKYHGNFQLPAPDTPSASYFPTFAVNWTASGAELSWDTNPNSIQHIIVKQFRTNSSHPIGRRPATLSHNFTSPDTSPQLITPACGGPGGPGDLPAFACGTWLQFSVWTVDSFGRESVRLYFQIIAS